MKILVKRSIILTGVLAAVLLIAGSMIPADATNMSSLTSASIQQKEEQIAQMEKEKEKLQGSLTDLQQKKKELETQKTNLKNYVVQLDGMLAEIEQNIAELNEQITVKEGEIERTQAELEAALETEQYQQESMITRIRLMYETDDSQIVAMLLEAQSLGGFLNRADSIAKITAYDKRMFEEYQANRQLVELCKEELELEKEILDQTKANVEIEQANLEDLIDQKNKDITAYENDISNKAQAIREYEQMIKEEDEEIAALEAAILEEKKKLLENEKLKYDGGIFKFPLADYTRVSDDYGTRIHPILGVEQFHNGVDFASPKGTAIYAAYDGKVVAATYSSTMGNYVMIDHGDELYTIYMHASALYVERGDIVARGETIAAVGSTGRSTGPHLHFSVRRNGAYVSPWEFLSR